MAEQLGPGRLLIAVYGVFAIAATARSAVQIVGRFEHAPVAYLLSAFAAMIYVVATITLASREPRMRAVAITACSVELVGVLAVGSVSLAVPSAFPDATVWSAFGVGYGFLPLVLPCLGLLWIFRGRGRG